MRPDELEPEDAAQPRPPAESSPQRSTHKGSRRNSLLETWCVNRLRFDMTYRVGKCRNAAWVICLLDRSRLSSKRHATLNNIGLTHTHRRKETFEGPTGGYQHLLHNITW